MVGGLNDGGMPKLSGVTAERLAGGEVYASGFAALAAAAKEGAGGEAYPGSGDEAEKDGAGWEV